MSRPFSTESTYRAIADPTRRRILEFLRGGERPVRDVASLFNLREPSITFHLRVLREAGLVRQRRRGTQRLYSLNPRALLIPYQWLARFQ